MYTQGRGRPVTVVPPKEKKALTITDKEGNVIDLTTGKKVTGESGEGTPAAAATEKPSSLAVASKASSEAGSSLRKAAEEAIKAGGAKKLKEEQEKAEKMKAEEEAERARVEKAKAEEEARAKEEAERLERERLVCAMFCS